MARSARRSGVIQTVTEVASSHEHSMTMRSTHASAIGVLDLSGARLDITARIVAASPIDLARAARVTCERASGDGLQQDNTDFEASVHTMHATDNRCACQHMRRGRIHPAGHRPLRSSSRVGSEWNSVPSALHAATAVPWPSPSSLSPSPTSPPPLLLAMRADRRKLSD
jgi:hypothetical protein